MVSLFLGSFWMIGKTFSVNNQGFAGRNNSRFVYPYLCVNKLFSGTEHSGIDDLILDVSQASYVNGEYVDAKELFNIDLVNSLKGMVSSSFPHRSPFSVLLKLFSSDCSLNTGL